MKEIKLINLKLKDFKGIRNLEIQFNGKDTNIYGANATGKTTIFDAFKWLFFNKNSQDSASFNYKTLDANNKHIHNLEHTVEATLNIAGANTTFKRVASENWVKKRGQIDQEFAGNTNEYYIDEIPCKLKDFNEKINEIMPELQFKLLTDPHHFCINMDWQKRKELLFEISNTNINDEDILRSDEKLQRLLEKLEGRSVSDYKKVIAEKIKLINKDLDEIPTRIDEANMNLKEVTEIDLDKFKELEEEKQHLQEEIENIDNLFLDIQQRAAENNKIVNLLSKKKIELNNLQNKLESEQKNEISNKKIDISNKINEIDNKIRQNATNIETCNIEISNFEKTREEERKNYTETSKKVFEEPTEDFSCPTCKQSLPTDQREQKIEELKDNFNKQKQLDLSAIQRKGTNAKESQERYEEALKIKTNENQTLQIKLDTLKEELSKLEKQSKAVESVDITSNSDYISLKSEVDKLEEQVANIENNTVDENLKVQKTSNTSRIEEINNILSKKDLLETTQKRVKELEEQQKSLAQNKQDFEQLLYLTEEFDKTKVEILENSINKMFNIIKFKLLEEQINGGIKDTCTATINGVPYSDLNRAGQILAGLDIINSLSNFYKTSVPIFIDNYEAFSNEVQANSQLIKLIVSQDKELKVEVKE